MPRIPWGKPSVHERVVRRVVDPRDARKTERIQAALAILGKQMTVEVRDEAWRRHHNIWC
jgi:hypothetical protein